MVRAFMNQHQPHPEWMVYVAAALWSINARLAGLSGMDPGMDLPPLELAWAGDVVRIAAEDAIHIQALLDEQEEEMLRSWSRLQE